MENSAVPPPLPVVGSEGGNDGRWANRWVFWALVVVVGLAVTCGGGFTLLLRSRKGLEVPTRSFLTLFKQGKYEEAWERHASSLFKEHESKEKSTETLEMVAEVLGGLESFKPGMFRMRTFTNGRSEGYIEYSAQFDKGQAQVVFTLQSEKGDWKINSYKFNSRLFDEFLRAKVLEDKREREANPAETENINEG